MEVFRGSMSETLRKVIEIVKSAEPKIGSYHQNQMIGNGLKSDLVVLQLMSDLKSLLFEVEMNRCGHTVTLISEKGKYKMTIKIDAYNPSEKIVLEVEAGQAVMNKNYIRNFMNFNSYADGKFLIIMVRNLYVNENRKMEKKLRKEGIINGEEKIWSFKYDFDKVVNNLSCYFANDPNSAYKKEVLIIGY